MTMALTQVMLAKSAPNTWAMVGTLLHATMMPVVAAQRTQVFVIRSLRAKTAQGGDSSCVVLAVLLAILHVIHVAAMMVMDAARASLAQLLESHMKDASVVILGKSHSNPSSFGTC
jgi:hypothetical protein